MKDILFLFNGPISGTISGGDSHAIHLANFLAKNNDNISVILPQNTYEKYFNKRIKIIAYKDGISSGIFFKSNFMLFIFYSSRLIKSIYFLNKTKSDLIIPASHLFFDIIPLIFIRNIQICAFIYHIISDQKRSLINSRITSFLEHLSFLILKSKKSLVITDARLVTNSLIDKYGFNSRLIYTSKNGLELKNINSVKVEGKKYDLVFCGRLNVTKGIYDLIKILQIVKRVIPNVRLAVIGSGPEKENFKQQIRNNQLDKNIFMLGFLSDKEKIRTIKESKFFVFPSHEEGWGIVIGESLACGVPVISYRIEELYDIWGKQCTWIDSLNIKKFSEAIIDNLNSRKKYFLDNKFIKSLDWDQILKDECLVINNYK